MGASGWLQRGIVGRTAVFTTEKQGEEKHGVAVEHECSGTAGVSPRYEKVTGAK